jgi:CO/xanthine dehydrogenase Mo-binding subunit
VLDPGLSLEPGAERLHPEHPNLVFEKRLVAGDAAGALLDSAHVVTQTYRTQLVEHAYLEPEAGFTRWQGGVLVVELPTKHAHFEQAELAQVLDLPPERIRIICTTIGGYFGDKQCLSPAYYAAIVTRLTGRPARMVYGREESFFASNKRHPYVIDVSTGCDAEGRLTAVRMAITGDTGAYASYGPSVMTRSIMHAMGPYDVPNLEVVGRLGRTNNPTAGSMRGFGVPQLVLAYESQMDLLAKRVGKTPEEIRRLNFLRPGQATSWGQQFSSSVGLEPCLEAVERRRAELPPHALESHPGHATAWGLAAMHYGIGLTGLPNPGVAGLGAFPGEPFKLCVGTGDGGQGAATTLVQIAAQSLGVGPEEISLAAADTFLTPNSGTATASRVTYVVGRGVVEAAGKLVRRIADKLEESWGQAPEFEDGVFTAGRRSMGIREAVDTQLAEPIEVRGVFDPPTTKLDAETGRGAPYASYAFAVQAAQVAVDLETGQVRCLRLVAAHDVGKVVHPVNVEAQVEGGSLMGLGYGLMEQVAVVGGRIANPGFRAYLIPSVAEVPELSVSMVECPEPTGPFGAKGVGEPALLCTAPAIHNAVAAILGEPPARLPLKAEDVWRMLGERRPADERGAA